MSDILSIDKSLDLNKKLKFLISLIKLKAKKNDVFTYSYLLEKTGYTNLSQYDLRILLNELVDLDILTLKGKNRYSHKEYFLNTEKLISYIYNSKICNEMKDIIHFEKAMAVT